jgi:predicted metal-dependent hydrolase
MTESRTVHIDHIGPVVLERSARARRIIISVRTERGVRVAVPRQASFAQAVEFVRLKDAWIRKQLEKIRQRDTRYRKYLDELADIDREKAKKALAVRLRQLAAGYGFTYKKLTVRNQRTRWGSCSHDNAISLNLKTIILPEELRDYVMLHELVHTRIHNHSKKFWSELDKYVGDGKSLASRLREYDLTRMG